MAKLYPAEIAGNVPESEAHVLETLAEQLGDDYSIFWRVRTLEKDDDGKLVEGEADIVLLHEQKGLLVLEVKGGSVGYDGSTRRWTSMTRTGREFYVDDPYDQAAERCRDIVKKISKAGICDTSTGGVPCNWGYGVVFPDCRVGTRALPPNALREITMDVDDLNYAGDRISRIYNHYQEGRTPRTLTPVEARAIKDNVLIPSFRLAYALSAELATGERRLRQLTDEQCRILDLLDETKRAVIRGCAGSGKTFLLMEKARRLSIAGKNVLVLCFNRPLNEHLEQMAAEVGAHADVATFHHLCRMVVDHSGGNFAEMAATAGEDFWKKDAPTKMFDALQLYPKRWDAVLVDEGQDFDSSWWICVEAVLSDPESLFYVFYDPYQAIYDVEQGLPFKSHTYPLSTNCRNTRNICLLLQHVAPDTAIKTLDTAPAGRVPCFICVDNGGDALQKLDRLVDHLVEREKTLPSEIVILSPHRKEHSTLCGRNKVGTQPLADWGGGDRNSVLFSTVHRFKGLESKVVIVTDIESGDTGPQNSLLYTAFSRAQQLLYVFHNSNYKVPRVSYEPGSSPAPNPYQKA